MVPPLFDPHLRHNYDQPPLRLEVLQLRHQIRAAGFFAYINSEEASPGMQYPSYPAFGMDALKTKIIGLRFGPENM